MNNRIYTYPIANQTSWSMREMNLSMKGVKYSMMGRKKAKQLVLSHTCMCIVAISSWKMP